MTTHAPTAPPATDRGLLLRLGLGALAWVGLYALNERFWDAAVGWLGLDLGERLVASVHFFLYDTVKIFLLLLGLMFVAWPAPRSTWTGPGTTWRAAAWGWGCSSPSSWGW